MSSTNSPSTASVSMNSPYMADSLETDATSQSSIPLENQSPKVEINTASLPWILHRILRCQLPCELPLRIMFAFNSGQKMPTLRQVHEWWRNGEQGKLIIKFLSSQGKITPSSDDTVIEDLRNPPYGPKEAFDSDHHPMDRFMDKGNERLLNFDFLAKEQESPHGDGLPMSFIQEWCLNRAFTEDYENANFDMALSALDYIRNLEVTRRATLRNAAGRLGIKEDNWRDILAADPDAKKWVENMQTLEIDISTYYANIFVNLRIWTMIAELKCARIYKPHLLAMLNTLFPPVVNELPNDKIDKAVLHKHRAHLYRCILDRVKNGPSALKHWVEILLQPGTKYSWSETRNDLEQYFERALNMVESSRAIHNIKFFRDPGTKHAPPAPSLSEFSAVVWSGRSTISSRGGHGSQGSTDSSTTRTTFESSRSNQRFSSRRKINNPEEARFFLTTSLSPWTSQESLRSSIESGQRLSGGSKRTSRTFAPGAFPSPLLANPGGRTASPVITPRVSTSSLRSQLRVESRPESLLLVQNSEAAQHGSFTRPITPFADKRQEVINRRETISSRSSSFEGSRTPLGTPEIPSSDLGRLPPRCPEKGNHYNPRRAPAFTPETTSLELNRPSPRNSEMGNHYNPRRTPAGTSEMTSLDLNRPISRISEAGNHYIPHPGLPRSRKSSALSRPPLVNDNLEFLKRPYEPAPTKPPNRPLPTTPSMRALKKVSSIGNMFVRKKSTVRNAANDNALGIEMGVPAVRASTESTETFPRFSQDTAPQPTRKKKSYGALECNNPRPIMDPSRSLPPPRVPRTAPLESKPMFSQFSKDMQSRPRPVKKMPSLNILEGEAPIPAPLDSTQKFSHFSKDMQSRPRTLKKKRSHGIHERDGSIPAPPESAQTFSWSSRDTQSRPRTLKKMPSRDNLERGASRPAPLDSTQTFSRSSQDTQSRPRTLKKMLSHSILQKAVSRETVHTEAVADIRGPDPTLEDIVRASGELKRTLKPKASMPVLPTKLFTDEEASVNHFFLGTGDDYERYIHVPVLRPAPDPVALKVGARKKEVSKIREMVKEKEEAKKRIQAKKREEARESLEARKRDEARKRGEVKKDEAKQKEVRKAKSYASVRSVATTDTEKTVRPQKSYASVRSVATNDMETTIRPRKSSTLKGSEAPNGTEDAEKTLRPGKSSLFRREPEKGDIICAKTIGEDYFPIHLQNSPALLDRESRSNEYTRRWLIEDARARRHDLNPPKGHPFDDEITAAKSEKKRPALVTKILGRQELMEMEEESEMPKATPKPLVRPERQRWDSIFPRRAPPRPRKEEPKKYTELNLDKYTN